MLIILCFHLCNTFNYVHHYSRQIFCPFLPRATHRRCICFLFTSVKLTERKWVKIKMIHNLIYDHLVVIVGEGDGTQRIPIHTHRAAMWNYDNFNYFVMHKLWDLLRIFFKNIMQFFHQTSPDPSSTDGAQHCEQLNWNMQKWHFRIIIEADKNL
jgi:hypothetical protein